MTIFSDYPLIIHWLIQLGDTVQYIGVCNITFFYEIMFSVSCCELKFYFVLKTVIYNIIEHHENKEMALTYDRNTYQYAGVASQIYAMHFFYPIINNVPPSKKNTKWHQW